MSVSFIKEMTCGLMPTRPLDLTVGVLNEFRMVLEKLNDPGLGWGDPLSYAGISPSDLLSDSEWRNDKFSDQMGCQIT